jgi:hypothetical protein
MKQIQIWWYRYLCTCIFTTLQCIWMHETTWELLDGFPLNLIIENFTSLKGWFQFSLKLGNLTTALCGTQKKLATARQPQFPRKVYIDGRTVKHILEKQNGVAWTEFIWLRIGTSSGLLQTL